MVKKMVKIKKKSLDRQPQKKNSYVIALIIHRETKKPGRDM